MKNYEVFFTTQARDELPLPLLINLKEKRIAAKEKLKIFISAVY